MAKKKTNDHKMHAMIVTFSVVAGLALAACQPQMGAKSNTAPARLDDQQEVIVTSPVPNDVPVDDAAMMEAQPMEETVLEGEVQGATDPAYNETFDQMDTTMQEFAPNDLTGSGMQ